MPEWSEHPGLWPDGLVLLGPMIEMTALVVTLLPIEWCWSAVSIATETPCRFEWLDAHGRDLGLGIGRGPPPRAQLDIAVN